MIKFVVHEGRHRVYVLLFLQTGWTVKEIGRNIRVTILTCCIFFFKSNRVLS